jgi:hypothetical protein
MFIPHRIDGLGYSGSLKNIIESGHRLSLNHLKYVILHYTTCTCLQGTTLGVPKSPKPCLFVEE